MKSHLKILGHPIHPMLVVFPLGLLVSSVAFDALAVVTKKKDHAQTAHKLIGAGVLTGLVAALTGVIDYLAIPSGTRAKRIGTAHAVGNDVLLLLFALSWKLRRDDPQNPPRAALGLSLAGVLLGSLTGWLGGELVYRLGVGVDEEAHLNAPDSLTED
jgi:uncharacterized membrane protein